MSDNYYSEWKNWEESEFGKTPRHEKEYFKKLFKKFNLGRNKKILEIGFGNGYFLNFANEQGSMIEGIEIVPELVKRANNMGFKSYNSIEDIHKNNKYDLIVMFDVLEHIPQEEVVSFLNLLNEHLFDGGSIILRTPNGSSPFGLANQYGDITHCNVVTGEKLNYWTRLSGMYVDFADGDLYPFIYKHSLKKLPSKIIKRILFKIMERVFRYIFAPQPKGFLSSNLFAILRKK